MKEIYFLVALSLFVSQAISIDAADRVDRINVCSFNIQFLGFTINRDNAGLAKLLKEEGCDMVVVQELVAPPSETYLAKSHLTSFPVFPEDAYDLLNLRANKRLSPKGILRVCPPGPEFNSLQDALDALVLNPGIVQFDPIIPEPKATAFFDAMKEEGFEDFILSEEDTGPKRHHTNTTASEWWLVFFNKEKLYPAKDLPHGFLDRTRAHSDHFERVPYAFPFRTKNKKMDFVLISVHLAPGSAGALRRAEEIRAIDDWVSKNSSSEKDFLILGDMNIQNRAELKRLTNQETMKGAWSSLNDDCEPTNTAPQKRSAKPYDHVFYTANTISDELPRNLKFSRGEVQGQNFKVISLVERMQERWEQQNPGVPYPGGRRATDGRWIGYQDDAFRTQYSDHNPIKFVLTIPEKDDD